MWEADRRSVSHSMHQSIVGTLADNERSFSLDVSAAHFEFMKESFDPYTKDGNNFVSRASQSLKYDSILQ